MFGSVLSFLTPYRWLAYMAGVAAVGALVWFGAIKPYNDWVTDEAVAAALKDERAKTQPVIADLTNEVLTFKATLDRITTASETRKREHAANLAIKTKELGNALAQNKTLKADLAILRGSDAEFNRLFDTITANNLNATGASASTRLIKLGSAHQQCEKELRARSTEHTETLERLGEALSVVRALKQ